MCTFDFVNVIKWSDLNDFQNDSVIAGFFEVAGAGGGSVFR